MNKETLLQPGTEAFSKASGLYYDEWLHALPVEGEPGVFFYDHTDGVTTFNFTKGEQHGTIERVDIHYLDDHGQAQTIILSRGDLVEDIDDATEAEVSRIVDSVRADVDTLL